MLKFDPEGYLKNLDDWSPEVAACLAHREGIELTPAHWEIIHIIRAFYQQFELSPAMRPLVKRVQKELGPDKGTSLHLLKLFPDSPAKLCAKIAGLPRPSNCL